MSITIRFGHAGDDDGAFRHNLSGGKGELQSKATTLREVLEEVLQNKPDWRPLFFDEEGQLRRIIIVYVNDIDVRKKAVLETALVPGDEVFITTGICYLFFQLLESELAKSDLR